jgi:hypothetical protein
MATGSGGGQQPRCPACGKNRFQWREGHRVCNGCGAEGWLADDAKGGTGRGKECGHCGANTLRRVLTWDDGGEVRRCTTCDVVVLNA